MKKLKKRIFWTIVLTNLIVISLIIIWRLALGIMTFTELPLYLTEVMKRVIPGIIIFRILYGLVIENILCWFARKKSAKIIADGDEVPKVSQVSGKLRAGKDASQVGSASILKEELIKRYKQELKKIIDKAYIYDFKKLNKYLDSHFDDFFVASKKAFKTVFINALKRNSSFIDEFRLNKVDPKTHLNEWMFRKGKRVPTDSFNDGVTPGGIHMLDLLSRYVKVYIRINFIPEYVMSNQPILENVSVEKSGRIKNLFCKLFSTDYIALKKDTPMPFILGLIIIESETGIVYANTDKGLEEFIKNESGIKEFLTTEGHQLEEEGYMRGITQDKNRPNATLRELYQGYIHIFRMDFAGTRDFFRFNYKLRRFRRKVQQLILKILFKADRPGTTRFKRFLHRKYQKTRKRISKLHEKDLRVWAKGYLVFYQGVYQQINDVGKQVRFPITWGIRENKQKNTAYAQYGFKQFNRITESFGRYNTHMMNSVREAITQIYDMHFTEVKNYTSMDMTIEQMIEQKYPTIKEMNRAKIDYVEAYNKELLKASKQRLHEQTEPKFVDLSNLTKTELYHLACDYGVNQSELRDGAIKNFIKLLDPFMNTSTVASMKVNDLVQLCKYIGIDETKIQNVLSSYQESYIKAIQLEIMYHHDRKRVKT